MGKHIFTKIREELYAMDKSIDVGYTKTYIPWSENRGISVECTRMQDNAYDEYGDLVSDFRGRPLEFSVYYQVNKIDEDCCTLSIFLDDEDLNSLKEFVNMYR